MTASHRFEDRLLEQLRQVVAERPAPSTSTHRRPQRARLALAGAGVAAATATAAIVATSGDVTPSAYAVKSQPGGAVTVSIRSLSDAEGLQRRLRAAGVPAFVDYVPGTAGGCAGPGPGSAPPAGVTTGGAGAGATFQTETAGDAGPSFSQSGSQERPGPSLSQSGSQVRRRDADGKGVEGAKGMMTQVTVGSDGATFTIDPGNLKPGDNVYVTTSTGAVSSIGIAIAKHKVDVPCPPAP